MIIELKTAPELLRVIRAVDPSYRKRNAVVHIAETCELHGTYWDGGSRNSYTAVDLTTFRNRGAPQYDPPQFGGPRATPVVDIPPGVVIVCTGIFCGKKKAASVYVHPANVNPSLIGPPAYLPRDLALEVA
jgi:hypothetical protein